MTWNSRTPNTVFRRLPVEQATGRLYGGRHRLRVVYRTRDLVVLGLGVMIGAGIFKISMVQAAANAGPAVILSFVIAGGVCLLAALAYAELSSIVPVAGSAYSFSYVAFGEVWAWVVGWALILELLLAASVVARAWSLYAAQVLADFGVPVPGWLGGVIGQPKGFDVFALGILLLLVLLLATGSRLGLRTLWLMVMAKLAVIGLVIGVGLTFFDSGNLTPFVPPARPATGDGGQSVLDALAGAITGGSPQVFGIWGILAAAPAIAFAYIGFDLIATASEETDDAPRKVPRGIITSLAVAVVLYVGVAVTMVGMVSHQRLDPSKVVLATPFAMVGAGSMGKIVDIGAVIALTTVILVVLISLTRVVFSMSRDGLLPRGLAGMSRFRVPSRATLAAGGAAVVMSQTLDVLTLEQMVVIGTLFAFLFGCAAVLRLRRDRPDLHRPFRMPAAPVTAVLGIVAIVWLMLSLMVQTWVYFAVWMLAGLLLYLVYGRRRSELRALLDRPVPGRPVAAPMSAPPPELARLAGPAPGTRPISTVPPGTPGVPAYQPERFPAGGGGRPWTPRVQQPQYPGYPERQQQPGPPPVPRQRTGPQPAPRQHTGPQQVQQPRPRHPQGPPPQGPPNQGPPVQGPQGPQGPPPQHQYPPQEPPRRDYPPQPPYQGGRHRR